MAFLALWSMIRVIGVVIWVGAEVSLEVVKTVWVMIGTGKKACEIFTA